MNVMYSNGEALHNGICEFITDSRKTISVNGIEVTIEHTQAASYNITELYHAMLDAVTTTLDAQSTDLDTHREQEQAITDAIKPVDAVIDDTRQEHYYRNREYVTPHDVQSAVSEYYLQTGDSEDVPKNDYVLEPSDTVEQQVADVLTLYLAKQMHQSATLEYNIYTNLVSGDEDDDSIPDPGHDHQEIVYGLTDTINQFRTWSPLEQPDPSRHLMRAVFNIYDDVGINPDVREVYGLLVSPIKPEHYRKNDATDSEMMSAIGNATNAMMGMGDSIEKWESVNEPPLER